MKLNAIHISLYFCLLFVPEVGKSFGAEDHILYLPGHTETVEWSEEEQRILFTCDYKNLKGVVPKKGEPCGPEPRLYFSKEDLQKLKYVVYDEDRGEFIYDNSRIIQRIYEKFPKLLIVIATDKVFDYSRILELEERGQFVTVRHPVDMEQYNFYAQRAGRFLDLATQPQVSQDRDVEIIAGYVSPFDNAPSFGFQPAEMDLLGSERPLADYALAVFAKNPDRTSLIHELLHHMIHLARARSIKNLSRLKELGVLGGLSEYLFDRLHRKPEIRLYPEPQSPESDEQLTNYIISFGHIVTITTDRVLAEEVELRYFIAKYGAELGILPTGLQLHKDTFWTQVKAYEERLQYLKGVSEGALMQPAYSFIQNNPHLVIDGTLYENYYHFAWDDAVELAENYPKDLLTRPLSPGSSATYLKRFSEEFFPRSSR